MSKSYIVTIEEKKAHENAERLEFCRVLGWWCITTKGQFNVGDRAIYVEVDSVMSPELVGKVFANSKIKPHNGRIRAVKIRGMFSQGLLLNADLAIDSLSIGDSTDDLLGITKYEPPEVGASLTQNLDHKKYNREYKAAEVPRYIDTVRFEKVSNLFSDDDEVHVTAKLHGSSTRQAWSNLVPNGWWPSVKLFFRKLFGFSGKDFICGTRNVDIGTPQLYHDCAARFDLKNKIPYGYVIYGEIVGKGIQKNYDYGFNTDDNPFGFFAYALKKDGKYVDYDVFVAFCKEKNIETVPLLARGLWKDVKQHLDDMLSFDEYATDIETYKIPCREGLVIGTCKEQSSPQTGERKIVKYINPEYLIKDNNTDWH